MRRSLSKTALELARQVSSIENEQKEEEKGFFDWFEEDKETEDMLEEGSSAGSEGGYGRYQEGSRRHRS